MPQQTKTPGWWTQAVLHPAFALTGVAQAIGGPLLPSLAPAFHLSDSESGLLFLLYFAGTSTGPFFYRVNYAKTIVRGYVAMAACCIALALVGHVLLAPMFLLFGMSVGIPMSGGNLYVGRAFVEGRAAMLTLLNFSWSAGALVAPLLAARVLVHHSYRTAYLLLAAMALIAAVSCLAALPEVPEPEHAEAEKHGATALWLISLFALAAFLQVGVEDISLTWLATFTQRASGVGVAAAAATSSLYWTGFLVSRGFSSVLLLRAKVVYVFRGAVVLALGSAGVLAFSASASARMVAMFVLGAALAPIYPLILAEFFSRARHTLDSRWVMTLSGFGGSILPWLAGWISTQTGNIRMGLLTIPAALIVMAVVLEAFPKAKLAES
ncbi:MAG TPA: MFS transporter [Terracidiphilus sp.]|nr:MFS transporter [Terracidiphilus sp.]